MKHVFFSIFLLCLISCAKDKSPAANTNNSNDGGYLYFYGLVTHSTQGTPMEGVEVLAENPEAPVTPDTTAVDGYYGFYLNWEGITWDIMGSLKPESILLKAQNDTSNWQQTISLSQYNSGDTVVTNIELN